MRALVSKATGALPRLRCLICHDILSLQSYSRVADLAECEGEPQHPHTNVHLAAHLGNTGVSASFLNCTDDTGRAGSPGTRHSRRTASGWLSAPGYDAVIAYPVYGAVLAILLSLIPWKRVRSILVILSFPNPDGPAWKVAARRWLIERAAKRADAVVCGLKKIEDWLRDSGAVDARKLYYSPTGVDTAFYDRDLVSNSDAVQELVGRSFILAVGDSSRDDDLLYNAVEGMPEPIVRVTRDPAVVERVSVLRKQTGRNQDLLLTRISYEQLRWLYSTCAIFVSVSRLDHYQAAGSTALTEALSCGAACICNSGGHLQEEFEHLAREAEIACPVEFLPIGGGPEATRHFLQTLLGARQTNSSGGDAAREFALRCFPIARSHRAISDAVRGVFSDPAQWRAA